MLAIVITVVIGLVFGALASRSFGIYFLMLTLTYAVIANLFFGSVTQFGGFSPIAGVNEYTPAFVGDIATDRDRLYYIALVVSAVVVYVLIRYVTRRRSASRSPAFGTSPCGWRRSGTRCPCTGCSPSASRRSSPRWPGSSTSGGTARSHRRTWASGPTIDLLIIAVIGGLGRIEGAWIGAFAFIVINNYVINWVPTGGLPVVGGRFNTIIGFVFLAIVIVSPDGLTGLWDRFWDTARRRGGPPQVDVETREAAMGTSSS